MTVREPYSASVVIDCILKICLNVRLVLVRDLPRHCPLELEERDLTNETSPILLGFQKSSPIVCLLCLAVFGKFCAVREVCS